MGTAWNSSRWDVALVREMLCHPCLYALSIEPVAELIRSDPLIQGICDEGKNQHKLALFADDISIFPENPITSAPALLQDLDEYSKVSGYEVNMNKSEAMMIVGD